MIAVWEIYTRGLQIVKLFVNPLQNLLKMDIISVRKLEILIFKPKKQGR